MTDPIAILLVCLVLVCMFQVGRWADRALTQWESLRAIARMNRE